MLIYGKIPREKIDLLSRPKTNRPILYNVIVFHGNCIDGWFSAYIAYNFYRLSHEIFFYPISPSNERTWPSTYNLTDTHIILLDVSVPDSTLALWSPISKSIFCIDHHLSSEAQWAARPDQAIHNVEACAAVLTWRYFYPTYPVPAWLEQIDRIDRWVNVTEDDRAVREVLYPIARMPVNGNVQGAISSTTFFINAYNIPVMQNILIEGGKTALIKKDTELEVILERGNVHQIDAFHARAWNVPQSWIGARVFIIDTTHDTIDSTEAAHIAMKNNPTIDFFVNYRVKTYNVSGGTETAYTYSARARDDFDLTAGGVFAGHPSSAGTRRIKGRDYLPFRPIN